MNKDYSALLSNKVWPQVQERLLVGTKGYQKETLKTVLSNTRQALLSDTQMQSLVYMPKLVLPLVRRLNVNYLQLRNGPRYSDVTINIG